MRKPVPLSDESLRDVISPEKYTVTESGCWEWNGYRRKVGGYGKVTRGGVAYAVHRISYAQHRGQFDESLIVRHLVCDNPPCMNPEHLEAGTHADNKADAVAKGRHSRGTRQPKSKLTQDKANEIRRRYQYGFVTQQSLADEYGVSQVVVSAIVRGKLWVGTDL